MINRPGRPQEPIERQFEFVRTCEPSKRDIAFVTLATSIHRSHQFERQHYGQRLSKMCKHVRALQICNRFLRVPVTLEDIENGGVCEILKQLIVLGRINLAFGVAKILGVDTTWLVTMIIARKTLIVNNCLSSVDFVGCEARILRSVLLLALCDRRTIDSNRAEYCDSHLIGKKQCGTEFVCHGHVKLLSGRSQQLDVELMWTVRRQQHPSKGDQLENICPKLHRKFLSHIFPTSANQCNSTKGCFEKLFTRSKREDGHLEMLEVGRRDNVGQRSVLGMYNRVVERAAD